MKKDPKDQKISHIDNVVLVLCLVTPYFLRIHLFMIWGFLVYSIYLTGRYFYFYKGSERSLVNILLLFATNIGLILFLVYKLQT